MLPNQRSTVVVSSNRSVPPISNVHASTENSTNVRLSLLPAFPLLHRHDEDVNHSPNNLLLANVSRTSLITLTSSLSLPLSMQLGQRLTEEQRMARQRGAFRPSYTLTDHRQHRPFIPSFFLDTHRRWYIDLAQRLCVDESILDHNYLRLFQCIDIMIHQRLQNRGPNQTITSGELLPVDEYAMALEFYLQIDGTSWLFADCRLQRSSFLSLFSGSILHEDLFISWCSSAVSTSSWSLLLR